MSWVWDHSRSRKAERLVLLAIADCASDDGANAYPSMAELVRKTGLSQRGVQGCIAKLAELGELRVHRNAGPGGCNRYRVVMTPAGTAPPQELHPPAGTAGPPPQELRDPPAGTAPGTVLEPSVEPSVVQRRGGDKRPDDSRGTRLPEDFRVDDAMKAWFAEHCEGVDGPGETAKFRDYWRAQPGQRGRRADWPATWRNWMRKAAEERGRRRPTATMTGANRHHNHRDDNPFRTGNLIGDTRK